MLRFSQTQIDAVANMRRSHENQHTAMNSAMGGQLLIGNASPLPRDVWGEWDKESVQLQRTILAVFNDLAASVARPMNIGKLMHYFRTVSDSGEINISLDGRSKAKADQPVVDYHGTPLPIIDSTFGFGWREMAAAQTENDSLEGDGRLNSLRKVAEKLENIALFGDANIKIGSDTLFGLTNHPMRGTRTTGVTLNGATGAQWQTEVKATLAVLHAMNFRENATLYVNWDDWFYAGTTDEVTTYKGLTIAQKITQMAGVGSVVPSSSVTAGTIIAVVKRREVLQVLNGMPITTRAQFRANPEDDYNFIVMAAASLEIKYDANDNCGVAHSSL
ncbi:MAG: encapsulating for peroxidase [Blastopirellula sp.]|nr:MAG: encapsulating for peroxidase [Blastopirellula sp.]